MLELIAAGAACAVASAAGTVILMRHNLSKDRAALTVEQDELDHAGDMQDLRYEELSAWAGWLAVETDRVNRWDAYIASLPTATGPEGDPETIGSTVDDEDTEVILAAPIRARFSYDPTAAGRVHTVALPEPGEVLREEQAVFFGETRALNDYASSVAESAVFGAEPFEGGAIDSTIRDILARAAWGLLEGGELTEALTAARVGMRTGQYLIITQPGQDPKPDDNQKPKLIGQPRVSAEVLHAIWNRQPRPQDEMPTPMPRPTNPAVTA